MPSLPLKLRASLDRGVAIPAMPLALTPERRLEVSGRLRDDFQNGRSYYPLHGQAVSLPSAAQDHPQLEFLRWHNETVYNGLA